MELERDLLKKLFEELRRTYAARGWQIDHVDLRWGISDEASVDNRTMRICIEELRRCRELSPRPNFIVLLGERYGWKPLPEMLSPAEYAGVMSMAGRAERKLMERWYVHDDNCLPDGIYELRRRDAYGTDGSEFARAEIELGALFAAYAKCHGSVRSAFDRSATEQEIREGALGEADQREHVVGYVRTFSSIPESHKAAFASSDEEERDKLSRLRDELYRMFNPGLIYVERDLDFDEYLGSSFADRFTSEMRRRISEVIEAEIRRSKTVDDMESERESHLAFAAEEAAKFYGRDAELQALRSFVESDQAADPLWIMARSGTGKSALTAKIVDIYSRRDDVTVVPVFCGLTSASTSYKGLYIFLRSEIARLKGVKYDKDKDLRDLDDYTWHAEHWLRWDFTKLPAGRKYLFVIDAIDQIEGSEERKRLIFDFFPKTTDKSHPLKDNVKIIFSTTEDLELVARDRFTPIMLSDMSAEASGLLRHGLALAGRRLTSSQWAEVSEALQSADMRPVYLTLLSDCLADYRSGEEIVEIPTTFEGLLLRYIAGLSRPERHGRRIVEMALALILNSRVGIYLSDLDRMLPMDPVFHEEFISRSHHEWDEGGHPQLPSVYRSRLYHDLQPLLRTRHIDAGTVVTVYHSAIRQVLASMIDNDIDRLSREIISDYYDVMWDLGHNLALRQRVPSLVSRYQVDESPWIYKKIHDILCDTDYALKLYSVFGKAIAGIYDEAIFGRGGRKSDAEETMMEDLQQVKNDLLGLPQASEPALRRMAVNLPSGHMLARETNKKYGSRGVLLNVMRDATVDATVEYRGHDMQKGLLLGDGSSMLERRNGGTELWHVDFRSGGKVHISDVIISGDSPLAYSEDKDYVAYYRDGHVCVDCLRDGWRRVWRGRYAMPGWMAMTVDGSTLYFGSSEIETRIVGLDDAGAASVRFIPNHRYDNGRLSGDGKALWFRLPDDKLDLNDVHKRQCYHFRRLDLANWRNCDLDLPVSVATVPVLWHEYDGRFCIFFIDGICVSYDVLTHEGGQTDVRFRKIDSTYVVDAVTPDMRHALCLHRNLVFDLDRQKMMVAKDWDGFSAANALTSDLSGTTMLATFGKRVRSYGMREMLVLSLKSGDKGCAYDRIIPPQEFDMTYNSAISPDGRTFAVSMWGTADFSSDRKSLFGVGKMAGGSDGNYWSCGVSMSDVRFSDDSRYVAFVGGNWVVDMPLWTYFVTRNGKLLRQFTDGMPDADVAGKHVIFSHDCRFAVIWAELPYTPEVRFLDLVSGSVRVRDFDRCSDQKGNRNLDVVRDPSRDLFYVSYDGRLTAISPGVVLHIYQLAEKGYDYRVRTMSSDGRLLFVTDAGRKLYAQTTDLRSTVCIAKEVNEVFTAIDNRHLFVVTDREVKLIDYEGRVKESAFLIRRPVHYAINSRGLAIADEDNDFALYVPSDASLFTIGHAGAFRRYDLETGLQEQYLQAVCPYCGAVLNATSPEIFCMSCCNIVHVVNYDTVKTR